MIIIGSFLLIIDTIVAKYQQKMNDFMYFESFLSYEKIHLLKYGYNHQNFDCFFKKMLKYITIICFINRFYAHSQIKQIVFLQVQIHLL